MKRKQRGVSEIGCGGDAGEREEAGEANNHVPQLPTSASPPETERNNETLSFQEKTEANAVSSPGNTANSTSSISEAVLSASGDAMHLPADVNMKSRLRRERNAQRTRNKKGSTPIINQTGATYCTGTAGVACYADLGEATGSSVGGKCQSANRRMSKERRAMTSSADTDVVEAYPPGEITTRTAVASGPVLLDPSTMEQSAHEHTIEEADAMVGTDVISAVVERNRTPTSVASDQNNTPGAFPIQGRAFGARRWSRVFSRRLVTGGANERASSDSREGSRLTMDPDGSMTMQEDPNLLVAETVDAEAVVYASGVVKERPRWVYYALGTLAVTFVLALGLSVTLTRNRDDNKDPRCEPPIEELNIYDLCFCQKGNRNASLLKLSPFEDELYDLFQDKLSDLNLLNRTLDRDACDFENQAVLRMANVERDPAIKSRAQQFTEGKDWNASGINAALINDTAKQLVQQSFVLQMLYLSTGGADWVRKDAWNSGLPMCSLEGVSCNFLERVQEVRLPFNNLTGSIPWQIGHMPFLKTLDLSKNPGLAGTIPSKLGDLSLLRELDLTASGLSGKLPSEIFQLKALGRLALSNNSFTGSLPCPAGLKRMREFIIGDAGLVGTLPSELGGMRHLHVLNLRNNGFTGTIPASFGKNVTVLEQLDLSHNPLTGTIPLDVYKLDRLRVILVPWTKLTGEIPQYFCIEPDRDGHVEPLILTSCGGNFTLTNGQDCWCCTVSHICVEDLPSLLQDTT